MHQAVRALGLSETERKLLERAIQPAHSKAQLQKRTLGLVLALLERIEPGAGKRLWAQLAPLGPSPAAVRRWKRSIQDPSWLGPARGQEVTALAPERAISARRLAHHAAIEADQRRRGLVDPQSHEASNDLAAFVANELIPGGLSAKAQDEIEDFRRRMLEKGHDIWTVRLALRRFFAPFCAWSRTGGVAPGWHQLSEHKQLEVVRLGLRLEEIWLGPIAWAARSGSAQAG